VTPDRALEVRSPGPLTLIEDLGRPGLADQGVSRSGAADRSAFRLGARLLAQDCGCAALEVTFGGLQVRTRGVVTMALTGAEAPATADGIGVGYLGPFTLGDGQVLTLGTPRSGLRTYLSVRGGIDVPPMLGSRSTDTLSGLGPPPVRPGDVLRVGRPPDRFPNLDHAPWDPPDAGPLRLAALPGPRVEWLADPSALVTTEWKVSSRSDRIGVRLEGQPLLRHPDVSHAELPSEGAVRGAVQVPPDGQPVLFLADHPVTGGYPVVAVIQSRDVDRVAQAVPGQRIGFSWSPQKK
jgi:biotin-dependent carboxylase-like uncharacterized protein